MQPLKQYFEATMGTPVSEMKEPIYLWLDIFAVNQVNQVQKGVVSC